MSRLLSEEPVRVPLGECQCPGSPHQEDEAFLRPRLTAAAGIEATSIISNAGGKGPGVVGRALGMGYLVDGLLSWNILDDDSEPIPATEEMLESGRLDWEDTLLPIADAASDQYSDSVINPLAARVEAAKAASTSSRNGRTKTSEPISVSPA